MELKKLVFSIGGLKPTVTKSVEPMALKKALTKLVYKP